MYCKQIKTQSLPALALAMTLAMVLVAGFYAAPVLAAKPAHAGDDSAEHGKSNKNHGKAKKEKKEKAGKKAKAKSNQAKRGKHFNDDDEHVVRSYYNDHSRSGKGCPPGLAKKDNGCMPPGQAKKQWAHDEPLPRNVEHHELPRDLLSRLPLPPRGQRYLRIASDILLVEGDTDVVIDAIVDILIP